MSKRTPPPLDGVRVLDLSRVLSGPFCTSMLADLGAEVVKIEQKSGDDARHFGPFMGDTSVYFAQINRGKKSLVVDLKNADDLILLQRLVSKADLFVENFRPGVTDRLGIGYQALSAINPQLIYVSLSGFGQAGPFAANPAYDIVIQAMSGLMSITGDADGGPTRVGESIADLLAGIYAAWAASTALFSRTKTGNGMHIDVAMFDTLLASQVTALSQYFSTGRAPGRIGNRHPAGAPFDSFQAKDGVVVIAAITDPAFVALCEIMGMPNLAQNPDFCSFEDRTLNHIELKQVIEAWTRRITVDQIVARCHENGVPSGPVWDIQAAVECEHSKIQGLTQSIAHPQTGQMRYVSQPVRFGNFRGNIDVEPQIGADRNDVQRRWLSSEQE